MSALASTQTVISPPLPGAFVLDTELIYPERVIDSLGRLNSGSVSARAFTAVADPLRYLIWLAATDRHGRPRGGSDQMPRIALHIRQAS